MPNFNDVTKVEEMNLIAIDSMRIKHTINIYFHWKQLDAEVRTLSTRGINFPSELSENFACYALGYMLNKASGGDAYDPKTQRIIEIKGSGSEQDDLSSFSPSEVFDELIFVKLDKNQDCLLIYETGVNSELLKIIPVNLKKTVADHQREGKRPRFSVMDKIIRANNLQPSILFNLREQKITRLK